MVKNAYSGRIDIRPAARGDCALILDYIRRLAVYEKRSDEVVATEESLEEWLFARRAAEVYFASVDGRDAGFMLFAQNFSTFLGCAGVHLEDIFILPEFRGMGVGTAFMAELGRIAAERGYGRIDWSCLNWNETGINFYKKLGAAPLDDWLVYRIDGEAIKNLARK